MIYGLWLLIISFFQMPIIVWKDTRVQLEALAEKDPMDLMATASPCITWTAFAGKAFITMLNVIIMLIAVLGGVFNLFSGLFGPVGFATGVGRLIYYPILGYLIAVVATWMLGYLFELVMLAVNVANDIQQIREAATDSKEQLENAGV